MAALDFIRRGRKKVTALHFNHNTPSSSCAEEIVSAYCSKYDIELKLGKLQAEPESGESLENFWRVERYKFFNIVRIMRKIRIQCYEMFVLMFVCKTINNFISCI